MNKHTEAIQALQPFASLLNNIEDLASACSVSNGDATFTIPVSLSDLQEASRVLKEWERKQSHPPLKPRIHCKTCGVLNYYQNLTDDRCPTCEEEMRIYLAFGEIEEVQEKKQKTKKKTSSIYEQMVKQMRAMEDEELESFLQSVPAHDAIVYRKLLIKY